MAQSFIPQNQVPNEVELKDLLALHRKQLLLGLNCHHIATVQDFDPDQQTASCQIVYKKTLFQPNVATGGYDPVLIDYPVLVDCPVIFLGGGSANLTFPVAQGDECLLLFNDRDFDNWFSGLSNAPVATPRLHAFTDAIALVGLRSLPNVLSDFDTDRAVLGYDNNAKLAVGADDAAMEYGDNSLKLSTDKLLATIGSATQLFKATEATTTMGTTIHKVTSTGKFSVTNATGEFVAALITFLSTANAGGYPIVGNLATLQSFQA